MEDILEDNAVNCTKHLVELTDKNGDVLRVKKYSGKYFTPCFVGNVQEHIEKVKRMDIRPDDVFITSFPRSGTHWTMEVVNMLVHGRTDYLQTHAFIGVSPVEKLDNLPSPRIIATHLPFKWLPQQLQQNRKVKLINVSRNPKDTCVSFYHYTKKCAKEMYNGQWDGYLDIFMRGDVPYGPWFEYTRDWEEVRKTQEGIMFLQYETFKKNFRSELHRIADFLGVSYEESFYDEIERRCAIKNVLKDNTTKEAWRSLSKNGESPIYRKGEIGDWKNHFTVAQNEVFDSIFEEKMKGTDIEFLFD